MAALEAGAGSHDRKAGDACHEEPPTSRDVSEVARRSSKKKKFAWCGGNLARSKPPAMRENVETARFV